MADKEAQRALCLARRRALSRSERTEKSASISQKLMALPALGEAQTILSYMAMEDEVDLAHFHAWALERGKRLAFPVSDAGGHMEVYCPRALGDMGQGRYGIRVPVPERSEPVDPVALDAVILPCVGFDAAGNRLGHGAGYYDRYLPRCPQALRVLVAFEAQRLEIVATEPTDQRVDLVITERQTGRLPDR